MAKLIVDGVLTDEDIDISVFQQRDIRREISSLESQITPRRYREAILGTDNGWLSGIETQIAELRAQL